MIHRIRLVLIFLILPVMLLGCQTPLMKAAESGDRTAVLTLLDSGADVNEMTSYGNNTALHYAAFQGRLEVVGLLLDRGADINAEDFGKTTPLWYAVVNGHGAVVKLLLERGARAMGESITRKTPLMIAEEKGYKGIATLLRQAEERELGLASQTPNAPPQVASVPPASVQPPALTSDVDRLPLTDPRGVQVLGKAPSAYVADHFGKSWAVVIGIDDYEKAPRLKYAVADAKAMAGVLRTQGFQVAELYNRQATKATIEGELSDRLVDRVGEQDRVVIFYAGHGETKTVKGGKTMGYLLPVEGQMDALGQTGVSMGRIKELADALPSKQVLFLVDVCYGGIAGQQFRSMLPPMTVAYLKQITRERGRQLITAGGPDQQAMESPEWGHSVFTYYLLEGLSKGLADLNDDGIIPASELYSYLDSRVFSAAQMKGHTQRPEFWSLAAEKGEFVFIPAKSR